MTIPVHSLSWPAADSGDPITIGGADATLILGDSAITGLGGGQHRTDSTDRALGGAMGGASVRDVVTVECEAFLPAPEGSSDVPGDPNDWDYTELHRTMAAMDARFSPYDVQKLLWSGLLWPQPVCFFARPTGCEPTIDETATHGGVVALRMQWTADDPYIYSDEYTEIEFGVAWGDGGMTSPADHFTFDVTNTGSATGDTPRSWQLRMTAHGGTLSNPKIENLDTGEVLAWPGLTMTAGQVLTVDSYGVSRVDDTCVDGYMRSGSSPFPDRPTLPPGASSIKVSCYTGEFSGYFRYRSTW